MSDNYFDSKRVWSALSEKTGKTEYFTDDGKVIKDYTSAKYGPSSLISNKNRFPTFEAFQNFRLWVIDTINDSIDRINKGEEWEEKKSEERTIQFSFEYPNGKKGDVNMYLADTYGSIEKEGPTKYVVSISSVNKDQLVLFRDNYFSISFPNNPSRDELDEYLKENNLYHKIRALHNDGDINTAQLFNGRELMQKVIDVADVYIKRIRKERNNIHTKLIEAGVTSPRWVSEFKLYTIIKSLYPDAVYQYRDSWLALQSLDIYIPSLSIGLEYQGIQHFVSTDFFGGDEALKKRIELDQKKKKLCKDNNVTLIEFRYDESLDYEYVKKKIESLT